MHMSMGHMHMAMVLWVAFIRNPDYTPALASVKHNIVHRP